MVERDPSLAARSVLAARLGVLVVGIATAGCGLLNGFTNGDVDSPLAGVFEGEGDGDGDEGEGEASVCVGAGCDGCRSDDDCFGLRCDGETGVCVDCLDESDCGADQACNGEHVCVGGDEGEGEEGEGEEGEGEGPCEDDADCPDSQSCAEGNCVLVESDPTLIAFTDSCEAPVAFTVQRGTDTMSGKAAIPEAFLTLDPGDKHVVVLLAEDFGDQESWRGPTNDIVCDLFEFGYGVITLARFQEAAAGLPIDGVAMGVTLLGNSTYNVPAGNISFVVVEGGASDLHHYLSRPNVTSPERVVVVSGYAALGPTPAQIVAAGTYPASSVWMSTDAAGDDGNCGATACVGYLDDIEVEPGANPDWGLQRFTGTGQTHGNALLQSTGFFFAGSTPHASLLSFFNPG